MSLRRLLRSHLRPYRKTLWMVVLLQAIQTTATLALPSLSADLINNGVLVGDTGYIWRTGAVMVGFSVVQIVFAVVAVWFGARAAMGFGRDVRRDLFHQVTGYSSSRGRRVRGTVAHHPDHERRPTGADARGARRDDDGRRPAHDGDRHRPGRARRRRAVGRAVGRDARRRLAPRPGRVPHGPRLSADADPHRPHQLGAARTDHRHPGRARRSSANPRSRSASRSPTPSSPTRRCAPDG